MRTIRDFLFDGGIRTISEVLSKEDEDDDFSEELEETNFSIDSEAAEAQTKTQVAMTREIIKLKYQIRVPS